MLGSVSLTFVCFFYDMFMANCNLSFAMQLQVLCGFDNLIEQVFNSFYYIDCHRILGIL